MYRRLQYTLIQASTLLRNNFFSRRSVPLRGKADIALPISLVQTNVSGTQDIRTRLNNYLFSERKDMSPTLKKGAAIRKTDAVTALRYFDEVINSFAGQETGKLTLQEKETLGLAYTYKANIIRVGTVKDQDTAFALIDRALTISPNLKEAVSLKNGMLAECYPDPKYDYKL